MPDTSHCCCGETPCTPCDPITITVTDSESGLPLKWASAYWVCNDVFYGRRLTNASGQTGFENICCNGDGYLRICRLCYDTQDIPFTDCPSTTVNVSLVKSATKPTLWVTNDTPYNNTWDGSAWVWPVDLPKIYVELTYQEVTDPVTTLPYNAWIGCEPMTMEVMGYGPDPYTGLCEPTGAETGSPSINVVLSCYLTPATGIAGGLSFYWLATGYENRVPADFTACFDWEAATTYDESFGVTSIYGVTTDPNCLPVVSGAVASGPFAPCAYADGTMYELTSGGPPGRWWIVRDSDPTPP
jgi:hypothetical protein